MPFFNIVAATNENTVVTEYESVKTRSDSYQSEAALEREFIRLLTEQGYEYLTIHSEKELIANLRRRLEALNGIQFSEDEWGRFFKENLANPNEHIVEKTRKMQEDFVQVLKRDDGSTKNITLIDKKNIHNNFLQVINQYAVSTAEGARHDNRYDVTVLVNGFPMVHIELKRRGVAIREAFNQIDRYQRDSFWSGSGLFEYVQIFKIFDQGSRLLRGQFEMNGVVSAASLFVQRIVENGALSFEIGVVHVQVPVLVRLRKKAYGVPVHGAQHENIAAAHGGIVVFVDGVHAQPLVEHDKFPFQMAVRKIRCRVGAQNVVISLFQNQNFAFHDLFLPPRVQYNRYFSVCQGGGKKHLFFTKNKRIALRK